MGLNSLMTGLADQVRRLSGRTGLLGVAAMTAALEGVETGTDVSGADAATGDVVSGKKFVGAAGTVETGTMPDCGAVSETLTASKKSYTVPAGYHNGSGVVKVQTQTKSVTPSASAQTVSPDSGYLLSSVTVAAAPAGKAVYTGTVTINTSAGTKFSVNCGVSLASGDTFILIAMSDNEGDGYSSIISSAIKIGSSTARINTTYWDEAEGVSLYGGGSITYSGTTATVNKGIYSWYSGSFRWYVIKA